MNGNEMIDACLNKTGFTTDVELAKKLRVTKQTVYLIRREEQGLSPELARKIAIIIKDDPRNILASVAAWKAKDKGTRDYWTKAASAAMLLLLINSPTKSVALDEVFAKKPILQVIHYANLVRKWIVDTFALFTRVSYSY